MKTFKFALMCAAALAMIACEPKNPVDDNNGGNDGGEDVEYVNPISVTDASLADWDGLENVATSVLPEGASMEGLKSVKVYADEMYINVAIEYNPEVVTDLSWTPLHMYINADNSAETGGFSDQWTDADAEIMLETVCFAEGAPYNSNPAVFKWWGEVGGAGWLWTDPENPGTAENGWGAIVAEGSLPIGTSQLVGNIFEIQIMWEMIPAPNGWNEEGFTIGFDIQQEWSSVGILPIAADDENGVVYGKKLAVKFN